MMDNELQIDRHKLLELGEINHESILDIGAGDLAIIAAEEFDCKVASIDVSDSILEDEHKKVKSRGLDDKIGLEKADATELPYREDEFDTVISYGALHHNSIEKRERFIEEALRVARTNFIITDFKKEHHIHPEDVHPPVDHKWLETKLSKNSDVKKYVGKEKILYVCRLKHI